MSQRRFPSFLSCSTAALIEIKTAKGQSSAKHVHEYGMREKEIDKNGVGREARRNGFIAWIFIRDFSFRLRRVWTTNPNTYEPRHLFIVACNSNWEDGSDLCSRFKAFRDALSPHMRSRESFFRFLRHHGANLGTRKKRDLCGQIIALQMQENVKGKTSQ